jgi:flagellar motor switch/type III secretory pathway protein FliN
MEIAAPASEVKSLAAPGAPWALARRLRCRLSVEIAVPAFTVRDLLRLEQRGIVETEAPEGSMVPIRVNGQTIARGEFEVIGIRLAIRILELT